MKYTYKILDSHFLWIGTDAGRFLAQIPPDCGYELLDEYIYDPEWNRESAREAWILWNAEDTVR